MSGNPNGPPSFSTMSPGIEASIPQSFSAHGL